LSDVDGRKLVWGIIEDLTKKLSWRIQRMFIECVWVLKLKV
jgi:hypothetical protein